jgi:hypothetical protein
MLFEPVFRALDDHQVGFVVVGGVAVVLHGHPRLTADLDLVIDLATDRVHAAVDALLSLGLRPRAPVDPHDLADASQRRRWVEERTMTVFSFQDPQNPLRCVDVFVAPPIAYDELQRRATRVELGSGDVSIASIDDIIVMKRLAGRAQDVADIEALERIRGADGP